MSISETFQMRNVTARYREILVESTGSMDYINMKL